MPCTNNLAFNDSRKGKSWITNLTKLVRIVASDIGLSKHMWMNNHNILYDAILASSLLCCMGGFYICDFSYRNLYNSLYLKKDELSSSPIAMTHSSYE